MSDKKLVFCNECDNYRSWLEIPQCGAESNVVPVSAVDRDRIAYKQTPKYKNAGNDCPDFIPRSTKRKIFDFMPLIIVVIVIGTLVTLFVSC